MPQPLHNFELGNHRPAFTSRQPRVAALMGRGGVSTAAHPDTELPTIFVHDGRPGGARFVERGFYAAQECLRATRSVIADCECQDGCPSCVQSPKSKCGNGNQPLDKAGAGRLLDAVLAHAPRGDCPAAVPGRPG